MDGDVSQSRRLADAVAVATGAYLAEPNETTEAHALEVFAEAKAAGVTQEELDEATRWFQRGKHV